MALSSLLNLFFKTPCCLCKKQGPDYLCSGCLAEIHPIRPPYCGFCGAPLETEAHCHQCAGKAHPFRMARAYGLYEGNLKRLVHLLKFYNFKEIAPLLGELLAQGYRRYPELSKTGLILPVPLSLERKKERGFNQSELLAVHFSLRINRPCRSGLLLRRKHTAPLFSMKRPEREKELENAFAIQRPELIRNKHLLLVDDIYTSGSTAASCAQALIEQGASSVSVYTLCKDLL